MTVPVRIWPGRPYPLGAVYDGIGTNFAVFSESAERIELCLFDGADHRHEIARVPLPTRTAHVFHGYVPKLAPGQLYGFRAHGPYDPVNGLRFNPAKVLVDPYAQAIANEIDWSAPLEGYGLANVDTDLSIDTADDAWGAPKGVVVDNTFVWGPDRPLRTPWNETVIYELHVKGFTVQHPGVPEALRGTYAGLASPAALDYLHALGVTAVELLPVHEIADERHVIERAMRNYWGYSTLAFFAPAGRYAATGRRGEQVTEFKNMVRALHQRGIEVILDVVYNHTAEGSQLGPTLSLRGLDNPAYYRLQPDDPRHYVDYSGCGNSLNARHPQALKLVLDSLRYWVTEMHVDGFRFDLATTLARGVHSMDRLSTFLGIMHQDPVLSRVKLIAEPWDVGDGGYQVGNFPVRWSEWNGKYRDGVRRFWKGDEHIAAEMGFRLTGSADVFEHSGRGPEASVNFVTAHDGFTMADLVAYDRKHNEANGEGNRDGSDENDSWNHGVEGPTDDPAIVALRQRQVRNLVTTLLVSQGVPMLLAGDEIGHSQRGNNNAYCQDNPLSWLDWNLDDARRAHLAFVQRVLALRKAHPVLRRRRFLTGLVGENGAAARDVTWLRPDGAEMSSNDWGVAYARAVAMLLGGGEVEPMDRFGRPVRGDSILVLFNAHYGAMTFVLPPVPEGGTWLVEIDTREAASSGDSRRLQAGESMDLVARSMAVLRATP